MTGIYVNPYVVNQLKAVRKERDKVDASPQDCIARGAVPVVLQNGHEPVKGLKCYDGCPFGRRILAGTVSGTEYMQIRNILTPECTGRCTELKDARTSVVSEVVYHKSFV